MDEELGKRLRSIANLDPDATFAQFHAETGSRDADELLAYLRERGLISGGTFCALHAAAPIRVTAFAAVASASSGGDAAGPSASPAGAAVARPAPTRPIVPDVMAIAPAAADAM